MSEPDLDLHVSQPGWPESSFSFSGDAGLVSVGRSPLCRVALESPLVSPRHLEIEYRVDAWVLCCCVSQGTEHNGLPLETGQRVQLTDGDQIGVGDVKIRVRLKDLRPEPMREPLVTSAVTPAADIVALSPPVSADRSPERAPKGIDEDRSRSLFDSLLRTDDQEAPRLQLFLDGVLQSESDLSRDGCKVLVGRGADCDLRVSDSVRVVSRHHARVERHWRSTFLYDLSAHGTFVNGQKVGEFIELFDQDRISLVAEESDKYGTLLVFRDPRALRPRQPERIPAGSSEGDQLDEAQGQEDLTGDPSSFSGPSPPLAESDAESTLRSRRLLPSLAGSSDEDTPLASSEDHPQPPGFDPGPEETPGDLLSSHARSALSRLAGLRGRRGNWLQKNGFVVLLVAVVVLWLAIVLAISRSNGGR